MPLVNRRKFPLKAKRRFKFQQFFPDSPPLGHRYREGIRGGPIGSELVERYIEKVIGSHTRMAVGKTPTQFSKTEAAFVNGLYEDRLASLPASRSQDSAPQPPIE